MSEGINGEDPSEEEVSTTIAASAAETLWAVGAGVSGMLLVVYRFLWPILLWERTADLRETAGHAVRTQLELGSALALNSSALGDE